MRNDFASDERDEWAAPHPLNPKADDYAPARQPRAGRRAGLVAPGTNALPSLEHTLAAARFRRGRSQQ